MTGWTLSVRCCDGLNDSVEETESLIRSACARERWTPGDSDAHRDDSGIVVNVSGGSRMDEDQFAALLSHLEDCGVGVESINMTEKRGPQ